MSRVCLVGSIVFHNFGIGAHKCVFLSNSRTKFLNFFTCVKQSYLAQKQRDYGDRSTEGRLRNFFPEPWHQTRSLNMFKAFNTVVLNRGYTYPLGVRSTETRGTNHQIFFGIHAPKIKIKCVFDCCECCKLYQRPCLQSLRVQSFL